MTTLALATELGKQLEAKQWVVGTAESCTGGLIAAAITDVAGSSNWFDQGFVTYANHSKSELLDVSSDVLDQQGAVSQSVVEAMTEGVLNRGADLAVATSGVAGPGGGTNDKPVGTVWFAWRSNTQLRTAKKVFPGDRMAVRAQATEYALQGLLKLLNSTV